MKTARMLVILVLISVLSSTTLGAGDTWTTKANMPTARYVLCGSVVNGEIYAIGGDAGSRASIVEAYNPLTDTWTRKANMPMARGGGTTSVVNGRIYYMGGRPSYNGANISSVIEYDALTDTWATKVNMLTPRTWLSSSVVDGKIYTIGGARTYQGAPLSTVEEYDPSTDTWTRKADMPTPRASVSTNAVNGRIYAIGGTPGYGQWNQGLSTVEEYDPATDTWTRKTDMPTPRTYFSTCAVNGKIYAIGGMDSNHLSSVEEYNPATDTWTKMADMPTVRSGLATSSINGKIYAIGGWVGYSTTLSTVEEYTPYSLVVDFNGDGIVDAVDMSMMIDHWHSDEPFFDIAPTPFGDGIIDVQDLVVLSEYLLTYPGALAYWKLDETEGNIAYDSIGICDGILNGDPTWQSTGGAVDGALAFDGVDDCVIIPFVLNPADGNFSIFSWIKGGAPGQVVVSQQGAANWMSVDDDGNLMTELKGTGRSAKPLLSQTVITDDNWHRIGLAWDGLNRTLYVDGVAVAQDTQNGLKGSYNGLYIGTDKDMESGTYFDGLIDDAHIYNRAIIP